MTHRSALLTILLFLTACAMAPPPAPEVKQGEFAALPGYLERLAEHKMAQDKVTGLSMAVVAHGQLIWSGGFGYADASTQQPATDQTLFRAGSLSKLVNAVKVMQLVEAEQLALDENIQTYLPDFSFHSRFDNTAPITLRDLLTHQSGLPSDLAYRMWTLDPPEPVDSVFPYLSSTYLASPPGEVYRYSNLGFDVIGTVIAKTANTPYANTMQSLLDAMGMQSAEFSSSPDEPPVAHGYQNHKPRTELLLRDIPAGGLSSNAIDLAQLLTLFTTQGKVDGEAIISPQSVATILSDYTSHADLNTGTKAGLGVFEYQGRLHPSLKLYTHNGATHSHRALILFSAQHRYGVVLLSNSANASHTLRALGEASIELLHQATYGEPAPTITSRWPRLAERDNSSLEQMTGFYATPAGLAQFAVLNETLKAHFAGKTFATQQQVKQGPHYLDYKLFGFIPIDLGHLGRIGFSTRKVNGKTLLIGTDTLGIERIAGVKIEPVPIPNAWRERVGDYTLTREFPVADVKSGGLRIKNGFLLAQAKLATGESLEYVLQPVNDHLAIIAGLGRSLGETVFAKRDQHGQWLEFSGLRFERE
ncbi:serine hydrolase domain-containing protein [Gilvimarinus xylanilyticus]|uniref:Beta-lactamase family protein n=1 Tax=Gilvimarinus xylanilyticus TaxID=2944139 RepID=A0A9X2KX39_9GAMM|nr:serine hydrolase domain-containing protein [Gilvimarinus xylanilyticus]MCP8900630.1 beta-lactamase family protein [Gilvimarinus xylanilyticus]